MKATEREPGAWGCNWATLFLGDINTWAWPSMLGIGRKADDLNLSKIVVVKSKKVNTGFNLAQFSKVALKKG
jgi:hypothetical protein